MNDSFQKLVNFANPEVLRGNLICTSLYIAFFETLKEYVINQPKSFYSIGFSSKTGEIIGPNYKQKVLSKDKRNELNASLLWFEENGAIDKIEIETIHKLRKYRNELTHEMLGKLYDGLDDKFAEYFSQLVDLKIKIERWWVFNIEIPTSDINPEDIAEDDVMTSSQILYKLILDVLSDDEEKAHFYYSKFLKYKNNNE